MFCSIMFSKLIQCFLFELLFNWKCSSIFLITFELLNSSENSFIPLTTIEEKFFFLLKIKFNQKYYVLIHLITFLRFLQKLLPLLQNFWWLLLKHTLMLFTVFQESIFFLFYFLNCFEVDKSILLASHV